MNSPSTESATIKLIQRRLEQIGYTYREFRLGNWRFVQFKSSAGMTWLTQKAKITYPFVSATARQICEKKHLAYELANTLGVATPFTLEVDSDLTDASLATILKQHAPLVVKPDDSTLSRGLTLGVTSLSGLKHALDKAKKYSGTVLVQNQFIGDEIRFVTFNGRVAAAMLRQTPRVVGDGKKTLRQLIDDENKVRQNIKLPYIEYPKLDDLLITTPNLDFDACPSIGQIIELSKSTMIKGGASVYDVTEEVHPSYIQLASKLAQQFGDGFLAVDMIMKNYKKPATKSNYIFLEFNTSPVLKLFYSCRDGKQFDALNYLVPMINYELSESKMAKPVFGAFEKVSFPELQMSDVVAKIDTGAYSGAIHCSDIHTKKAGKKEILYFKMPGYTTPRKTTNFRRTIVTGATGHRVERYIINTVMEVQGKQYVLTIGISDRSNLRYPVLIGRRFLAKNAIIVDASRNRELTKKKGGSV